MIDKTYKTIQNQLQHWRNVRDVAVLKVGLLEQDEKQLRRTNDKTNRKNAKSRTNKES